MTLAILIPLIASIVKLTEALTALITAVLASQPKDVQAELWKRHIDSTQWISKMLARLSDLLERLIEKEAPVPPKPAAQALRKGKRCQTN